MRVDLHITLQSQSRPRLLTSSTATTLTTTTSPMKRSVIERGEGSEVLFLRNIAVINHIQQPEHRHILLLAEEDEAFCLRVVSFFFQSLDLFNEKRVNILRLAVNELCAQNLEQLHQLVLLHIFCGSARIHGGNMRQSQ